MKNLEKMVDGEKKYTPLTYPEAINLDYNHPDYEGFVGNLSTGSSKSCQQFRLR